MEWFLSLNWELFVKLLGIILSWPVVIGLLAFYFLREYKDNIKTLLDSLDEGAVGGFSFKRGKPANEMNQQAESEKIKRQTKELLAEKEREVEELARRANITGPELDALKKKMLEREEAYKKLMLRQMALENELEITRIYKVLDELPNGKLMLLKRIVGGVGKDEVLNENITTINAFITKMSVNPSLMTWLIEMEVVNEEIRLTRKGYLILKIIAEKM